MKRFKSSKRDVKDCGIDTPPVLPLTALDGFDCLSPALLHRLSNQPRGPALCHTSWHILTATATQRLYHSSSRKPHRRRCDPTRLHNQWPIRSMLERLARCTAPPQLQAGFGVRERSRTLKQRRRCFVMDDGIPDTGSSKMFLTIYKAIYQIANMKKGRRFGG